MLDIIKKRRISHKKREDVTPMRTNCYFLKHFPFCIIIVITTNLLTSKMLQNLQKTSKGINEPLWALRNANSWVAVMGDCQSLSSRSWWMERQYQSLICLMGWRDITLTAVRYRNLRTLLERLSKDYTSFIIRSICLLNTES